MKEQFIKWAEENGWDVVEVEEKADLPDHIKERYIIPETWYDFIAKFRLCQNRDFTKWFLTPLDYKNDRNEGFRWNEYEMQSLDWCDGDDQIIAFWNTHLPIFRSVDGSLVNRMKKKLKRYAIQKHGLSDLSRVTKTLNEAGILSFADFGTLLGIIREQGLLKHDLDIDVGVMIVSDADYRAINSVMEKLRFVKSREFTIDGRVKEQSYFKRFIKVDLQYYTIAPEDSTLMNCYLFYNPGRDPSETKWKSVVKKCPRVKSVRSVTVQGYPIDVPDNAEDILVYKYGANWKKPDKGWVYWEGPNTYPSDAIGDLSKI